MTPEAAVRFPDTGTAADELIEQIGAMHADDIDWRGGRAFSLVYHTANEELDRLLHEVAALYLHDNGLNPFKYPSLMRMEVEVIAMGASLLGAPDPTAGSMTSGGTESIFLAVHTAREEGRSRGIARGAIVIPETAHPAFSKAAHYLELDERRVPVRPDGRADVDAMAGAIDAHCVLVVGSAPSYPFGVIDPIPELAAAAAAGGVLCHVDACLGGWLLPFWERLGEPVPPWDFRVEGVTSLSADLHKYGWCFKGASLVLYRTRDLLRRQHFIFDSWPGGIYASATTAGTRPAPPIAAAWTVLRHLGLDGYLRMATTVRDTTRRFQDGILAIDGLRITPDPDMSVFQFGSDTHDMAAVCDVMDDRGWNLDRQPGGLHLMVSPGHAPIVDEFCRDLADAVAHHGPSRGTTATYGAIVQ